MKIRLLFKKNLIKLNMRVEIGSRVGAIQSADSEKVDFYGYGVYEGEEIPSKEENEFLNKLSIPNPKIKLDSGKFVWGYECWWGPEDRVKEMIGERTVNIVE